MYSIDIDIGGTFTDGFFTDGRQNRTTKVLTTPHDITEGLLNCIESGGEEFGLSLNEFLLRASIARVSTTVGTNLIVQKSGPRLGLIVTKGQETNLYGKGTAQVIDNYVKSSMVIGVEEAVDKKGRLVQRIDQKPLLAAVRKLVQDGARMIVLSFQNAWRNPDNELRARNLILERYPVHYLRSVPLQLGTEVIHDSDDHARTNSAVLNAYIHTEMARTLYRGEDKMRAGGFDRPMLVVHANGGNARVAKTIALNTLHSGPAVAARGAAALAKQLKLGQVVTTDMGGTSLDVSIIKGGNEKFTVNPSIDGVPVATPMIEVESIGAGGGSIAKIASGSLRVGPESAGAAPGPACYGKGGLEPTVTDANLLLGFIDPENFLGGRMRLDGRAAERMIKRSVAEKLKISAKEASVQIRRKINDQMGAELRKRLDVQEGASIATTLFSFGGSGPLHACSVAEAAGISKIISFPFGSVFSAFGSNTTNVQHTYSRTLGIPLKQLNIADDLIDLFREQALTDMEGEGFKSGDIKFAIKADLKIGGGSRTLSASGRHTKISQLIKKANIGRASIDAIHCRAECEVPHWAPLGAKQKTKSVPKPKSSRDVCWDSDGEKRTNVFERSALKYGHQINGPALVEAPDTAYAVNPGWRLVVDQYGNFVMSRMVN